MEQNEEQEKKKRGRRPNGEKVGFVLNRNQTKFFVDVSNDKPGLDLIFGLLEKANQKVHGRELTFKDLCLAALVKLTDKDIERLQEASLTEMQKVQRALDEFNAKNSVNLSLGEFLIKKLNIT